MICPHELASDFSALRDKGCEVRSEVINAGRPVPGSRGGAINESARNRDAGDVETDHVVAGGGNPWGQHANDETDAEGIAESRL